MGYIDAITFLCIGNGHRKSTARTNQIPSLHLYSREYMYATTIQSTQPFIPFPHIAWEKERESIFSTTSSCCSAR